MGHQKFSVTHPRKDLVLKCKVETHLLTINPNIGSLWLDVPSGCQFKDNSNDTVYPTYRCVDKTITYGRKHQLPAVWSQVPVSVICVNVYLYFKLRRKFHHYQRQKLTPKEKSTFKLGTVKFSSPQQTFIRPQDRPLPDPIQEEECHYLTPQQINLPSTSTTTSHRGSPHSSSLTASPMPTAPNATSTIAQPRQPYLMDKLQYVPMNKFFV
ncbi:hypothetical protein FQR65_LT17670 [Abscondita terminalis]|nr:hypothetical protein FQR65_LT17670 [Abscondita terminalis]